MKTVPFEPAHLAALRPHLTQQHLGAFIEDPTYIASLAAGCSWSLLDGDKVLGCGGLLEAWPGHCQVWALLGHDIGGRGMLAATRVTTRMLSLQSGRIETFVAASFPQAQRWMDILGFTRETPGVMRKWFPDGADAILYSRVT